MTREDAKLVLKDLCSHFPYGVMALKEKGKGHICDINLTIFGAKIGININPTVRDTFSINDVKPYLFPLSSMTEEQKREYNMLLIVQYHKRDMIIILTFAHIIQIIIKIIWKIEKYCIFAVEIK